MRFLLLALCCIGHGGFASVEEAFAPMRLNPVEATDNQSDLTTKKPVATDSAKGVGLIGDQLDDVAVRNIQRSVAVRSVTLAYPKKETSLSAASVAKLSSLPALSQLVLVSLSDPVGKGFLNGVKELRRLKTLKILDTKVDQTACQIVSEMRWLEEVQISGTRSFDDECLVKLKSMPRVKKLSLFATSISDASVEVLKGWPALKVLDLRRTKISPKGVERLEHHGLKVEYTRTEPL